VLFQVLFARGEVRVSGVVGVSVNGVNLILVCALCGDWLCFVWLGDFL